MLRMKKWRWLSAAVLIPLTLAACTGGPARPGHGTGPARRAGGPSSAASGDLTAVRHVWVIELENQGYAQRWPTAIRSAVTSDPCPA